MNATSLRPCVWIAVAVGHLFAGAARAEAPYRWSPVTIKGNGFVNGVTYNPAAKDCLFINTDMGGAYRWDAAARQWACMTDWARCDDPAAKHMGVETLAVDPTDAGRVYFALGTYMSPTALMRSRDGGRTFERIDAPFRSNGNGSARNTGQRLAVDPNLPDILLYGTRADGLFKSIDAGGTWSRVTSFPTVGLQKGWGKDTGILFVHFDKTSGTRGNPSRVLYAGVFDTTAGVDRLYRSTDAGQTWAALRGGQPKDENLFPQRMAATPDGQSVYVTYATSRVYPGPFGVSNGRVFKVIDPASETPKWTEVTPPAKKFGYSGVAIDPADSNTVYVTELGNYSPADRIWRSRDGGANWQALNPQSHRDDASAPYASAQRIHWMGDLQIDPFDRNVAIFTTGYGLYRTTNLTADEPTWAFFNDGFEQTAAIELASPFDGPVHLLSAIGDRDGYRHTDFARPPDAALGQAQGLARGTSVDIDVARADSDQLVRLTRSAPCAQYSMDNGITWHAFAAPPISGAKGGQIALSKSGRRVVWWPERAGSILYGERDGDQWGEWKTAWSDVNVPNDLAVVSDLETDGTFYGVGGGVALRSADGGATWHRVSADVPHATRLRAVPDHPGHLWSCGDDRVGLWRSTDGAATWTRVKAEGIPLAYVVAVGAPESVGGYPSLYVGGRIGGVSGVFRSDDEGKTWQQITDDQHHYGALLNLQGDPRAWGRVYLATNGRGIVCGDLAK